jgi:predicted nucleic acid-binding protein
MINLLDTNLLLRLANTHDPLHALAVYAVTKLELQGHDLRLTPQVLIEFWASATRPLSVNGLGLSSGAADRLSSGYEANYRLLDDTPDIYPAWKALVRATGVIGKQVHDARLAAVCHVHGVSHVLTFNVAHFARYANFGPGLTAVHPSQV